jgi:iron complex outermembrane receptor protein
MESDRFEFRTEIEISDSDLLTGIDLNFGYGDYQHSESGYESEDNETEWHTHATYLREGFEGKIAFKHEIGNLRGVFGIHGLFDEFKIVGEESIFGGLSRSWDDDNTSATYDNNYSDPSNPSIDGEESSRISLFLIEEYDLSDDTKINAGIRWESIKREYQSTIADRDDNTFSASGGISHDLSEIWNVSGNVNYSERTPDTAELYSDGAHHATEAYEIGNPNLENETAVGFEVIVRKTVGKVTGQFSAFHTKYNDYIFLEHNEGVERGTDGNPQRVSVYGGDGFAPGVEGLEEKAYEAVDAEFQGIEVEIDWLAMENQSWDLLLSFYGDTITGKNKTEGGNLPRIPASRLGFGFEVMQEKLDFGMKLTRSLKQDNLGDDEEVTPAFSILNAFASYDINFGNSVGQLFLKGSNLTDELAYNHASVLKQFAPLPGRSFEVGLKFDF